VGFFAPIFLISFFALLKVRHSSLYFDDMLQDDSLLFHYAGPFLARWLKMDELRVGGGFFVGGDQEPAELLLAVGVFLFVAMNKLELKHRGGRLISS